MGQLIDDLLRLAHITRAELRFETVNLTEIAREISASLDRQPNAHPIRWQIDAGLQARGDQALMRIAMQNLLDNAWKFTGRTADAVIGIGAREQNGQKVFFVTDNGAGFDMAYANRLFEAFQRLHSSKEFSGTGIGLAIVQRIVRRHGGRIWAEATIGAGATIFFTLGEAEDDSHDQ